MFCSTCGNQLTQGLSFCNRCGASQKERVNLTRGATTAAFLTAITVIAVAGLGIMLGGALALKNAGNFGGEVIGPFMAMTFFLVLVVEFFLCRQLSRLTSRDEKALPYPSVVQPPEMYAAQQRVLPEPLPSVTENTTRTLEYSRNEALRR